MKHSKHIIPYALYPLALQRKIAHTEDKTTMKNILTILLCFAATLANAKISITKLTCELRDGFVVTTTAPRLGWQMTAEDTQEKQTAYQIRVSSAITGKMVLDTKRIESSQSQLISVSLGNGFYTWQVRVWDKNGKPSAWSKKAKFAVQDNAAAFGNAQWVGAITKKDAKTPEGRIYTGRALQNAREQWNAADPLSRRSIYVAKTFTAKKKIRHAVMNVCGLGFSEVSINGEKIGDGEFSPLWSDYDKSVFYNTYDVTEQFVRCKQNTANIEVLLGNGFYNEQGGRYHKLRISFGPPTLKMCIHITYTDGTTEDILNLGDMVDKFASFGCHTVKVNGHDIAALEEAITNAKNTKGVPSVIVLDTIKGRGNSTWETSGPSKKPYKIKYTEKQDLYFLRYPAASNRYVFSSISSVRTSFSIPNSVSLSPM